MNKKRKKNSLTFYRLKNRPWGSREVQNWPKNSGDLPHKNRKNPNFHKFPKLGNFFIENGKFHIKKCKNFISSIGSFRKLFLLI